MKDVDMKDAQSNWLTNNCLYMDTSDIMKDDIRFMQPLLNIDTTPNKLSKLKKMILKPSFKKDNVCNVIFLNLQGNMLKKLSKYSTFFGILRRRVHRLHGLLWNKKKEKHTKELGNLPKAATTYQPSYYRKKQTVSEIGGISNGMCVLCDSSKMVWIRDPK